MRNAGTPKSWITSGECRLNWIRLVDRQHQRRDVAAVAGRCRRSRRRRSRPSVPLGVAVAGVLLADAVVEGPRPLLAGDLDGHVGVGVELDHLVLDADGVEEEDDAHQDRRDRVEDLERQVVARLHGDLVVAAAAELHHDVEDQAPDDDAGDHRGHPGPLPQLVGVGTLLGVAVGHREVADLVLVGRRSTRPAPASSRRAARPSGRAAPARLTAWGLADPLTSLSLGPSRRLQRLSPSGRVVRGRVGCRRIAWSRHRSACVSWQSP